MNSGMTAGVVGGGLMGLSIAWRLAQQGLDVTVHEAGRCGNEASWAGAGMLAPGGEYSEAGKWTELAVASLEQYQAFVEELEEISQVTIDFRRCGAFTVSLTEQEVDVMRATAERQAKLGIYSEQFPPSRIPGLTGSALAAQYYPRDSIVNPRDLISALLIACRRAGVSILERTPVQSIGPGWPFDITVIAAGAWSGMIQAGLRPLPQSPPIRGHLIAFSEPRGLCDTIVRHNHNYLLRRADGVLIAGASTEQAGFDRTIDGKIAADLAASAIVIIPELAGLNYSAWCGFRPGSASGEPIVGRLPDSNIWLAFGHYRNGILLTPITAKLVTEEIMQASSQKDSLSPASHLR